MKKQGTIASYRNQIVFTLLFILIGVLFMTLGFWKTMLFILFTGSGYFIGLAKDEQRSISSMIAPLRAFFER